MRFTAILAKVSNALAAGSIYCDLLSAVELDFKIDSEHSLIGTHHDEVGASHEKAVHWLDIFKGQLERAKVRIYQKRVQQGLPGLQRIAYIDFQLTHNRNWDWLTWVNEAATDNDPLEVEEDVMAGSDASE